MTPAETQIIEQFRRLDADAKRRVLDALTDAAQPFDVDAWFAQVDAIQATVSNPYTLEELAETIDDVRGQADEDGVTP